MLKSKFFFWGGGAKVVWVGDAARAVRVLSRVESPPSALADVERLSLSQKWEAADLTASPLNLPRCASPRSLVPVENAAAVTASHKLELDGCGPAACAVMKENRRHGT